MKKSKISTKELSYTVIYKPVKKGGYQVIVPLLPGLVTFGRDLKEAQSMARDAIKCHLEGIKLEQEEIPEETSMLQERVVVPLYA